MADFKFPKNKLGAGQPLEELKTKLLSYVTPKISQPNGDIVYHVDEIDLVYDVFTHENVLLLINNGGEITNYTMYAECPDTIYAAEVPEGLPHRTIKVINSGAPVLPTPVKKFNQWCDHGLFQTFKSDFSKLYVTTTPHGTPLSGSELKLMVEGFGVQLISIKEYNARKANGEIVD